jgi:hypothetical protein
MDAGTVAGVSWLLALGLWLLAFRAHEKGFTADFNGSKPKAKSQEPSFYFIVVTRLPSRDL